MSSDVKSNLLRLSAFCGIFVFAAGLVVFFGLLIGWTSLSSLFLSNALIQFLVALSLCLSGGALLSLQLEKRLTGILLAVALIIVACLFLILYFSFSLKGLPISIQMRDRLFPSGVSRVVFSPIGAFFYTGLALLLLSIRRRPKLIFLVSSQLIILLITAVALSRIISYFSHFIELIKTPHPYEVLPITALVFTVLCVGLFSFCAYLQKKEGFPIQSPFVAISIILFLTAVIQFDQLLIYQLRETQFFFIPDIFLGVEFLFIFFGTYLYFYLHKQIQKLMISRKKMHSVINNLQDAIITIDEACQIRGWNTGAERIFGYKEEEMNGRPLKMLLPKEFLDIYFQGKSRFSDTPMAKLVGSTIEVQGVNKGGIEFPIELSLSKWDVDGRAFYTSIIRDITSRKETEKALEKSMELAEAANRLKSEFLANMSHEIRTPMTAILGYTELLLNPSLSVSERLDFIQTIQKNSNYLLKTINDILDLAKIESGKLSVEKDFTPLQPLMTEVLSMVGQQIFEKGLSIEIECETPIPEAICTDPQRLKQILINLIGNSIKFTMKGGIKIVLKMATPLDARKPLIQFDIVDSGIGMTEEQQKKLFRPFVQVDSSTTRQYGGSGLGLAISKRLASLLGGTLSFKSLHHQGSTFSFTIETGPLTSTQMIEKIEKAFHEESLTAKKTTDFTLHGKILLVEDSVDSQRLISYFLTRAGAEVEIAENGKIACRKAQEALKKQEPYAIILMDIQMPIMDGYTATSFLRSKGYTGTIIALTAYGMLEERKKCLHAGCDDVIVKPIEREVFLSVVQSYLEHKKADRTPARITSPLYSIYADDPEMSELIAGFIYQLPNRIGALRSALHLNDIKTIKLFAHQLRGTAGSYGFPQITEIATRLERLCDENATKEEIIPVAEELIALCAHVKKK